MAYYTCELAWCCRGEIRAQQQVGEANFANSNPTNRASGTTRQKNFGEEQRRRRHQFAKLPRDDPTPSPPRRQPMPLQHGLRYTRLSRGARDDEATWVEIFKTTRNRPPSDRRPNPEKSAKRTRFGSRESVTTCRSVPKATPRTARMPNCHGGQHLIPRRVGS